MKKYLSNHDYGKGVYINYNKVGRLKCSILTDILSNNKQILKGKFESENYKCWCNQRERDLAMHLAVKMIFRWAIK